MYFILFKNFPGFTSTNRVVVFLISVIRFTLHYAAFAVPYWLNASITWFERSDRNYNWCLYIMPGEDMDKCMTTPGPQWGTQWFGLPVTINLQLHAYRPVLNTNTAVLVEQLSWIQFWSFSIRLRDRNQYFMCNKEHISTRYGRKSGMHTYSCMFDVRPYFETYLLNFMINK